jgi:hypothetical protein
MKIMRSHRDTRKNNLKVPLKTVYGRIRHLRYLKNSLIWYWWIQIIFFSKQYVGSGIFISVNFLNYFIKNEGVDPRDRD